MAKKYKKNMSFSIFMKKVGKRQNLVSLYHPRKFFPNIYLFGFRATDHPVNNFFLLFKQSYVRSVALKSKNCIFEKSFLGRYGDTKCCLFPTFFMKIEKDTFFYIFMSFPLDAGTFILDFS